MNSDEITIHQPAISKTKGSFESGERTISAAPATILMPYSVRFSRQSDAAKLEVIFSSRCRQVRGRNAINNETAASQRPEAVTMMRAMVCTGADALCLIQWRYHTGKHGDRSSCPRFPQPSKGLRLLTETDSDGR